MRPKKTPIVQPTQPPQPEETRDQQRQRLADLIGKLLAWHWLAERRKQEQQQQSGEETTTPRGT